MSELQIICVDDAKALVRVGVPEPERATPQEVRVSVRLALQPPPSFVEADRIGATVDYDQIIGFIRDDLGEPAHLIETLADRVAGHCLKISARALWVEVIVKKPAVLSGDGMVAVAMRREKA